MSMTGYMSYQEISERTGISPGALRRRLAAGTMPPPDGRVGKSPIWKLDTIRDWIRTASPGDRNSRRKRA